MDETLVRSRLEQIGLSDEQISDVLPYIADVAQPSGDSGFRAAQAEIFEQMQSETDWRKRASLAAKYISISPDY